MTTLLTLAAAPTALIWLLVYVIGGLIVLGLVYWAATRLMAAFGIGDPIRTVVIVLLVVIIIGFIVYTLFGMMPR